MKTKDLIAELTTRSEIPNFRPDRAAGLARLAALSGYRPAAGQNLPDDLLAYTL
jgi:hypothetical protein